MGLRELHCTLPPILPISLQAGLIVILGRTDLDVENPILLHFFGFQISRFLDLQIPRNLASQAWAGPEPGLGRTMLGLAGLGLGPWALGFGLALRLRIRWLRA